MTLNTELGPEQPCRRCGEFWPADAEFFITCKGRLQTLCRACNARERHVAPNPCELESIWHATAATANMRQRRAGVT